MRHFVQRHPVISFVALAYGLSWAAWAPLLVSGATVVPGGTVSHFPGLLGPAAASIVVTALLEGRHGVTNLARRCVLVSRPTAGFFAISLSPLAFLLIALTAAWLIEGRVPAVAEFAQYSGLPLLSLPIVLLPVLLFNGFGEEIGWRGFALPRLQARFGAVPGALALAAIWAGWHLPSFRFVEGYASMGLWGLLGVFGLGICAGSIVLARVYAGTSGSLLAVALWHAAYNMTSATAASRGVIGAVTTTCVMVWAVWLLLRAWRNPGVRSCLDATASTQSVCVGSSGARALP